MPKARSRFLTAAEKANERRAPFFYQIKKLSSDAKSDFPGWLQIEIREAGGTKGWIKKNAYWQKRLRQQYHSIIADKLEERSLKKLVPKWLFEEVCSFGRVHWLKVHAAKGREVVSAPEARYQKLRADILSVGTWRPVKITGKAERLDIRGQCFRCGRSRRPIYYAKSDIGKTFVCSPCRDRLLPKKDALDRAVSGGAFGMNRRRH